MDAVEFNCVSALVQHVYVKMWIISKRVDLNEGFEGSRIQVKCLKIMELLLLCHIKKIGVKYSVNYCKNMQYVLFPCL